MSQDRRLARDFLSPRCKVCNTMVVLDAERPLPKVWRCPNCGAKNYSKPREQK